MDFSNVDSLISTLKSEDTAYVASVGALADATTKLSAAQQTRDQADADARAKAQAAQTTLDQLGQVVTALKGQYTGQPAPTAP